jgi:uncharacterized protein YgbK (DUF1537 family)
MEQRWLILADDLTGAADSAIAFARRRLAARVVWGDARPEDHLEASALAYDVATRELDGALAARRHGEALHRLLQPGTSLFKKIDSTLRGHPAEEIAAMLDVMLARVPKLRVVLAPSFPATGRAVRDGQVWVHGVPLPLTEYWPPKRDAALANLVGLLEAAGLPAHSVPLTTVRGDRAVLRATFAKGVAPGRTAVAVCDAVTDHDLERIAEAGLDGDDPVFFIGSAGLAHALAQLVSRGVDRRILPQRREPTLCGALLVVGSRSSTSRAALEQLATVENVRSVSVEPAQLTADVQTQVGAALAKNIGDALRAGVDVVVDIAQAPERGPTSPLLVAALSRLLAPAARDASALVATGGETAATLFARLGVTGIQLLDEIEPGIALGITLGGISLPAVTKAGGFGNEESLKRVISRLRFIRQTGTVA